MSNISRNSLCEIFIPSYWYFSILFYLRTVNGVLVEIDKNNIHFLFCIQWYIESRVGEGGIRERVCVCVSERETEKEWGSERERERIAIKTDFETQPAHSQTADHSSSPSEAPRHSDQKESQVLIRELFLENTFQIKNSRDDDDVQIPRLSSSAGWDMLKVCLEKKDQCNTLLL